MRLRRSGLDKLDHRTRLDGARGARRPSRSLLVVLVLACATLITLDYRGGADSPIEPFRTGVATAFGPVEAGTTAVVRPFTEVPGWFRAKSSLRHELAVLEAENSHLRGEVATSDVDRNRIAELDGLTRAAGDSGYSLVPARVIGLGAMQSFSRTVTIDAGTSSGIHADMTVLNNDGLVGRVLRATRNTSTVLLVLDADSVVGGRLGSSMEVGFLRGGGVVSDEGRLDFDLVDDSVTPTRDDVVVTWGSEGGAPYVSGIPIGRVTTVFSSPRETSKRAVIAPFVDFTSLDLVGVVVETKSRGDRSVIRAQGGRR